MVSTKDTRNKFSWLRASKQLGQHICDIELAIFPGDANNFGCNSLAGAMTGNCSVSFGQSQFRLSSTLECRLIVGENISRTIDLNAHHSKFVAQSNAQAGSNMRSAKLKTKGTGLNGVLLLCVPDNRCFLDENEDDSLGMSGFPATSMISIDKARHGDMLTQQFRSSRRLRRLLSIRAAF